MVEWQQKVVHLTLPSFLLSMHSSPKSLCSSGQASYNLQAIIFLYLLDNNTSFVVLGSAGVGTLIEFWKITKAVDVSIDRSGRFPKLSFKDKAGYSCVSKPSPPSTSNQPPLSTFEYMTTLYGGYLAVDAV